METFVQLEKKLRNIVEKKFPETLQFQKYSSFRDYINILFQKEIINYRQRQEFLELNRYRNLIFHGHVDKVDNRIMKRINLVENIIDKIKDE